MGMRPRALDIELWIAGANLDDRNSDKIVVEVINAWHFQPKQIRLQKAQEIWALWASIHTPTNPDNAGMEIVDHNGNRVGYRSVFQGVKVNED